MKTLIGEWWEVLGANHCTEKKKKPLKETGEGVRVRKREDLPNAEKALLGVGFASGGELDSLPH